MECIALNGDNELGASVLTLYSVILARNVMLFGVTLLDLAKGSEPQIYRLWETGERASNSVHTQHE